MAPMRPKFNYTSVIGKLNFLVKSTHPDLAYAVHQCARFSSDPKQSHVDVIKRIGCYLKGTQDMGITLQPDPQQSFQCRVDTDFTGNWRPVGAQADPMTAKSRSGGIITYAGCPITWASKLQTLTAMSTTKAEYMALSMVMCEHLPLLELLREVKDNKVDTTFQPATIHCKAFEDNSRAVKNGKITQTQPTNKHVNNSYHHFCEHIQMDDVQIVAVKTDDQLADLLTKPLADDLFLHVQE